jgi:hypothetical protein
MVSMEVPREYREFSIGAVTIADTFGIALAGFVGKFYIVKYYFNFKMLFCLNVQFVCSFADPQFDL